MIQLPITVIIATKNEAKNLPDCLRSLGDFAQIIVHDSGSNDHTKKIAKTFGAHVIDFAWDGQYPKKRQYALDTFGEAIHYPWVFFVDADERIPPALVRELWQIHWHDQARDICGFFVRGRYTLDRKLLKFGLQNNKIALIHRDEMHFPIVNDLNISPGMGEMEGHYQPVKKLNDPARKIKQLKTALIHESCSDMVAWHARHARYAHWEDEMDKRRAWPQENNRLRRALKHLFKALPAPLKAAAAFTHSYIFKLGFLDGRTGFKWATLRAQYYWR